MPWRCAPVLMQPSLCNGLTETEMIRASCPGLFCGGRIYVHFECCPTLLLQP